jgi:hypothetical protein
MEYRAFDNRPYLPNVLCHYEVAKIDGKANEAILERYMIDLNDK